MRLFVYIIFQAIPSTICVITKQSRTSVRLDFPHLGGIALGFHDQAVFRRMPRFIPKSEVQSQGLVRLTTDYRFYGFFGLEFFTIYNFGEVAYGTYFNP